MREEMIVKIAEDHFVSAKLVQVIEVRYRRGAGIEPSALREVTAWFHLDGRPVAEEDPCKNDSRGRS